MFEAIYEDPTGIPATKQPNDDDKSGLIDRETRTGETTKNEQQPVRSVTVQYRHGVMYYSRSRYLGDAELSDGDGTSQAINPRHVGNCFFP